MDFDDDFKPRLGRQRDVRARKVVKYASRVAVAAGLIGSGKKGGKLVGSRIGRGAALGRALSGRDRLAGYRARRVVVKTRLVRVRGPSASALKAHLHYIQRDGVTKEGERGVLYGPHDDRMDGAEFLERSKGDRHQFRFIVSAEDGDQYGDLKPYIRRLMNQVEEDLGTKLEWVAVDHHNTGHPHTHIVLRGIDDRGKDLVIARDYISHGFRERAVELMSLDLGPRADHEIEARLRHEMEQERLTGLDRRLLGRMDADRCVSPHDRDPFFQALEAGRLQALKRMDLASEFGDGRWQLADRFDETLRAMGERGDIIRLMQREVTRARLDRQDQRIYSLETGPIVGRVICRGLADEHRDRHFLLVDGIDGRSHYVDIGPATAIEQLPRGAIVRVSPRIPEVREIDRNVLAVSQANEGRYSVALHQRRDRSVTHAYAQTHVRRLEAMRRARFDVTREIDGSWRISEGHLAIAERFEQRDVQSRPVNVEMLGAGAVDRMAAMEGTTWLDRELASPSGLAMRDAGFGREARAGLDQRRQWLVEQDLADVAPSGVRLRQNVLALLQRRELLRLAAGLSSELGKEFAEAKSGDWIEGKISRRIDGISDRFALIERSHEFTLVPWRPVLEKQLGQQAGGIMREAGINWQFGRGRSGPEIS
ncbi:relaxase/mobilization nuclease RlxS [Novosphingobium sp.]|uniref:relaxase/mobilization nuclease RlxS n=1 Tax=Novosphingobium sp. TaxID=1874826 RepID=UPI0028A9A7F5|nr:relaxase/mobilization nuclease RlxS [Novosphingobium sp.]